MRAARSGGRFWEHEVPTPEELDDKMHSHEDDREDFDPEDRGRTDSTADLRRRAGSAGTKGSMTIGMNDMSDHRYRN